MTRAGTITASDHELDDLEQAVLRRLGTAQFETEQVLVRQVAADGAVTEDQVVTRLARLSLVSPAR